MDVSLTAGVTAIAPVNIALLKYWGKADELNVQPFTDSLSLTLSTDHLHSRTRIRPSPGNEHTFILNGKPYKINHRMKDMIIVAQLRSMLKGKISTFQRLEIESDNNFPTAAGLASSASGMASLAYGLTLFYGLDGDIASLARRGSGSACRSMFGGFVHWKAPQSTDDIPSSPAVVQLHPHTHWPELRVLICVISADKKTVGSTVSMRTTMQTSCLFREARKTAVAERLPLFIEALQRCDFSALAELTMRESNALHAACLDSWPPAVFLNETSFAVMRFVHLINQHCGRTVLAYTFDAGPNAFLLVLEDDVAWVLALLAARFGEQRPEDGTGSNEADGDDVSAAKQRRIEQSFSTESAPTTTAAGHTLEVRGLQYPPVQLSTKEDETLLERLPLKSGGIRYVISTQVGPGPHS
ncbi:hypothetical protein SprV_0501954700 [Sparganum proliferum]